ncbi:methyl-accepting chemotaxis protein [Aestuariibacter halophilus]|uniref:Methyl-accepting chemotaxis protein n=1 Tax=Fluctibacter halophilus TaxID=226011 RepID=A0ABS8G882_9ALTE|nr:methyl-accepting chemotaxis protein [Aestuariibacter halophilus]MCC2616723.1 methyl-accepting chemotaxis protein [Aestuariibacter halophilus]
MIKRMNIAQRVYSLGIIELLLLMLVGGIAIAQMSAIGKKITSIAEYDVPLSQKLSAITRAQSETALMLERGLLEVASGQSTQLDIAPINNSVTETLAQIDTTRQFIKQAQGKDIQQDLSEVLGDMQGILNTVQGNIERGATLITQIRDTLDNNASYTSLLKQRHTLEDNNHTLLIEATSEIQRFTLLAAQHAEQAELDAIALLYGVFFVTLVFALLAPLFISRSITTPINYLVQRLQEVASGDGDLRVTLDESARDETGKVARAFNQFLGVLRSLVSQTSEQANSLRNATHQSSKIVQSNEQAAEHLHQETDQVASAVTEMNSTISDVARSTARASELTDEMKNQIAHCQEAARKTQTVVHDMTGDMDAAAKVVGQLMEESTRIGMVLDTIREIAEQTNLLALNAAIEAARAGESGRGFAVVADEVRTLAQRTQTSTVDIEHLVESLQSQAQKAVKSMQGTTEQSQACESQSEIAVNALQQAIQSADSIADLATQIAAAAEQQSIVVDDVNRSLLTIKQNAENTAKGASETSSHNSRNLSLLDALNSNLSSFKV